MAHYVWNQGTNLGQRLRTLVYNLNSVLHEAADIQDILNQMSDSQVQAAYTFSDGVNSPDATVAGNAKAELLADLSRLTTDSSQSGVHSALKQLLSQFA